MKLFGKERNIEYYYNQFLPNLIIFDLLLISFSIIFEISDEVLFYIGAVHYLSEFWKPQIV